MASPYASSAKIAAAEAKLGGPIAQDSSLLLKQLVVALGNVTGGGGGGSGTVTSVSVTTQNGVSATVTNPTTTPALAFTLGAITPTTVQLSGSVSGTTLLQAPAIAGSAVITFPSVTSTLAIIGNPLSQFASTTSAQLAGIISDKTGSGSLVFATSPTLVTPILGTPTSGTLTNCTGLPVSSGISGLGTGVATALAVNTGSAGAFVVNGGALGTPSSGTLTNCTGLPAAGVTGLGTMATQNASAVAITGGTIAALTGFSLRDTSAAFNVTLAATSSTALTAGKTITIDVKNTDQTLKFTAASTVTFPSGTNTLAVLGANTFTGVQTLPNGSVSAPAINLGDSGTGLYRAASNTIDVTINGTRGYRFYNSTYNYLSLYAPNGVEMSIANIYGVFAVGTSSTANTIQLWSSGSTGTNAAFSCLSSNGATEYFGIYHRSVAGTIQFGQDAAGVTNQTIVAANRITSDGVGANLTIAAGNGRGAAGGSLILSTYTTAGAGTAGTQTARITIDTAGVALVANCGSAPAGTPSGGGYLYAEAGALKWKGSGGTVTTLAAA